MNASDKTPKKTIRRTLSFLGKPVDCISQPTQERKQPTMARVSGPYQDPGRSTYRLVVFDGIKRKSVCAESKAAALQLKEELERSLAQCDRTIGAALEEYLSEKRQSGLRESSVHTMSYKLVHFLPTGEALSSLKAKDAQALYEAEMQRISRFGRPVRVQTHQIALKMSKLFFRWAVEKQYIASSPFEKVRYTGKPHVGKEQLRIDEGRQFAQVLVSACEKNEIGAIAALTQLMLGLRSSEVLCRQVRDLDDNGCILWIPLGKTENARRRLEVPEVLQPFLLRLVEGQPPERLIFGESGQTPHNHIWLWRQVRNYCRRAQVPQICPHSLRGLHSSLAIAAGCTSSAVASALGHGSFAITGKHYVDPDTLRNTELRRVATALTTSGAEESTSLRERLLALTPGERQALLRALAAKSAA